MFTTATIHPSHPNLKTCLILLSPNVYTNLLAHAEERLPDRIKEHVTKQLWMYTHGNFLNFITKYLLESRYGADAYKSVQVITQMKTTALPQITEKVFIQKFKLSLCVGKWL